MYWNGAPISYIIVNVAALIIAILAVSILHPMFRIPRFWLITVLALLLGSTMIIGPELQGVRRWIAMGPVNIHVGMLVVPALCVAVAGGDRKYTIAAFVVMSATFAAQPDRGTAIGLLFAALIFALLRRNWISGLAVLISGIGLTVTMYRADQLAGVTFVEHVIEESIADGGLTWILILTSLLAAILSPVILIDKTKSDKLVATAVFSSFFFGLSLASVIGEYPTPLVGYGASPIIGYGLGIAMLSKQTKDTENG